MNRNIKKVIKAKPKRIGRGTVEKRPVVNRKNVPNSESNRELSKNVQKIKTEKVTTKITKNDGVIRKPQQYSKINQIYKGHTVYLIGGGPSLTGFDWERLRDKSVIAINKAFQFVPWAKVIFWTDSRFYTWYHKELDNINSDKYTITNSSHYKEDVKLLKKGTAYGLSKSDDTISHGNNSGYAAINLAYNLGAKRIVLLGYDMGGTKSHFHNGYPVKPTSDQIYQQRFIPGFPIIADELNKEGVLVYNTSQVSPLTCFPKIDLIKSLSI